MAVKVNRITNANIYLDGGNQLGKAEEVKLPEVAMKMVEHKALGMVGMIELPAGIEKMTGEIKWSSFYKDVLKKVANPYSFVSLQVRANIETFASQGRVQQAPLVAFLTVAFTKLPGGTFKQHDNVEAVSPFACYYLKVQMEGEDIVEFDAMANIHKVGGVDLLAAYTANVGG
jgi:P2 family phage contractile tail tube protein